jgi:hypothetical protein
MSGRKVVEGEEVFLVFHEALHCLGISVPEGGDEEIEGFQRILAGGCEVLVMQFALRLRLEGLGKLVQDVPGLVEPAALYPRFWPDLGGGGLETHHPVAYRERGHLRKSTCAQIQGYLLPRLRTLRITIGDGKNSLLPKESALMTTSRQERSSSSRAGQYSPSAHT